MLEPQAIIDDSATQPNPKYFVLAGFVSSAARWAEFSDEWQAALDLGPNLDYFKMNEANLLIGQFARERGWTEKLRDDRVITLTRIIKRHVMLRLHASIRFADFEKYIASIKVPERKSVSDHPYIYLFTKLIAAMAVRSTLFGINEPCDFIFDDQEGVSDEIFRQWANFKETALRVSRSDFPRFLGERPIFRNDKLYKPLQAADLFANQYRNHLEFNSGRIIVPPNRILRQLLPISAINHDCTGEELEHLRAHLEKFKDELLERFPAAELFGFASTSRERRLIRKRARRRAIKPSVPYSDNP
jgi:Protein of unknown function (DUF3800)